MRNAPMMASPFEYRSTMWDILYEGEDPPPPKRETDSKGRPRKALPAARRGMTNRDRAALSNFMDDIAALKEAREIEDPPQDNENP